MVRVRKDALYRRSDADSPDTAKDKLENVEIFTDFAMDQHK